MLRFFQPEKTNDNHYTLLINDLHQTAQDLQDAYRNLENVIEREHGPGSGVFSCNPSLGCDLDEILKAIGCLALYSEADISAVLPDP